MRDLRELQELFASVEGEETWTRELSGLLNFGALDEAEEALRTALEALDTDLARTCLAMRSGSVALTGWDELAEAIEMHEGEPVTGVTIAIGNETDRAFEKGEAHSPHVMMGIYTDEAFAFSSAGRVDMLAELASECPAWAGYEEDVEVHLDITGLDAVNTALLHHKERHFFRDGSPDIAPARYIEYVMGCWWRALCWHQAVAKQCGEKGLPGEVQVISGTVEMRTDAACVHSVYNSGGAVLAGVPSEAAGCDAKRSDLADSFGDTMIRRGMIVEEEKPMTGSELRKLSAEADAKEETPRPGIWARIFGRK